MKLVYHSKQKEKSMNDCSTNENCFYVPIMHKANHKINGKDTCCADIISLISKTGYEQTNKREIEPLNNTF